MSANLLGGTAIKPPERNGFEAFKWFMYDPDKAGARVLCPAGALARVTVNLFVIAK